MFPLILNLVKTESNCKTVDSLKGWTSNVCALTRHSDKVRSIAISQGNGTPKAFDADKPYKVRGGVELSFYHDEVLMLEGQLMYTRYIPTDSEQSSYGGLGWQFAIFPVGLSK